MDTPGRRPLSSSFRVTKGAVSLADDGRRSSSSTRHAQKASPARCALASPCMTRNTAARCRVMLDTRAAVKSTHAACPLSLALLPLALACCRQALLLTAPHCQAPLPDATGQVHSCTGGHNSKNNTGSHIYLLLWNPYPDNSSLLSQNSP